MNRSDRGGALYGYRGSDGRRGRRLSGFDSRMRDQDFTPSNRELCLSV
jgi:hypothetical protein